jgi:predicted acylesterase/phospholipase RssA
MTESQHRPGTDRGVVRAAGYQVGVLKAIRELLREPRRNPFPILCGTSAGALNTALDGGGR